MREKIRFIPRQTEHSSKGLRNKHTQLSSTYGRMRLSRCGRVTHSFASYRSKLLLAISQSSQKKLCMSIQYGRMWATRFLCAKARTQKRHKTERRGDITSVHTCFDPGVLPATTIVYYSKSHQAFQPLGKRRMLYTRLPELSKAEQCIGRAFIL